jgi:hypothetical protein
VNKKGEWMEKLIFIIFIATIVSVFAQEVTIAKGKLSFDGCVLGKYYFLSTSDSTNKKTDENSFARLYGFLGLTGTITDYAKVRFYYDMGDISGTPAYDIFMCLSKNSYELRVGQFKPPTGIENLTPPPKLDFIEYSTISKHRTSTGITRDIGLQLATKQKFFECALAVINGNGRNQLKDNNKWKDLVGRLVFTPQAPLGLTFGGNLYWGKFGPDTSLVTIQRVGAELALVHKQVMFKSEFVYGKDGSANSNGFYVSAGYRYCNFQPVVRFERYTSGESQMAFTGGFNWFVKGDNVKPMLNYTYLDDKIVKIKCHKVSAQLQFSF